MARARRPNTLDETLVIFFSEEDGRWIAHGLRTDQIGDGETVLDAVTDAIRAVRAVLLVAHDDPTVAVLREAPPEIQRLARSAESLPREIYEIAHRKVMGEWPQSVPVTVRPDPHVSFTTEIREAARS